MNSTRQEFSELFAKVPLFLIGVFLILFPLIFSVQTTDAFLLPKHFLLAIIVTLSIITLGLRMVSEGKIRLKTTPFDVPVLLFTFVVIISAFLSVNKFDALIATVPFMYAALLYYSMVNTVRGEKALLFILASLVIGSSLASLISFLSFFHIYVLPLSYTRSPYFTAFGSLLDQAVYLTAVLPIAGFFAMKVFSSFITKRRQTEGSAISGKDVLFTAGFIVIAAGLVVTLFYLFTSQKPLVLPLESGFQIAFAAISQDAGRVLKSFMFGSGYGTFMTDFMRFKQASYNSLPDLWSVTFIRSSSFILELLATTGMLGVLSFLFIVYRVIREKTLFLPLIALIIASFIIPFSPLIVTLLFTMLGIFAIVRAHSSNAKGYDEVEMHLIAFKEREAQYASEGLFKGKRTALLPGLLLLVLAGIVGVTDYYTAKFAISDVTFQKSLVAASQNNGALTYDLQRSAITTFPYRDVYQRIFSQTNLALANALAQQTPAGSSPSAQVQQNVLTLIQQSINTGRSATTISPYSAPNWNNLSGIYRSLIGFGQNADKFAVLTNQQAIALDPSNPQQYVNLGGIYYQLGMYDDAIRQFQIAIQMKPDYANAYYNAGHALEAKQQYTQALSVYDVVKQLVSKDTNSSKQIAAEMDALKKKVEEQNSNVAGATTTAETTPTPSVTPAENNPKLDVNKPSTVLPTRNPQAKIDGPSISPVPTTTKAVSPTPTK